jgi:gliding motility-associated-like protein
MQPLCHSSIFDASYPPMKKSIPFLLLVFTSYLCRAQTDTVFWFAAPEVSIHTANFDRPIVLRMTTSAQPATVTISQPAGGGLPPQVVNIAANSTQTVDLTTWIDQIENKPANANLNYGLKIQSTTSITAYYEVVSAQCQCNPEIFVLKGQNALGNDFWIPSQNYLDNNNAYSPVPFSSFDVVATQNNTTVTITPSNAIVGHAAGVPFNVLLQEGQTYSATAASGLAAQHLQGSRVTSDKPIAITVKDDLLNGAPFGGCSDLGGDQIVPVNLLGTEYVAMSGFLNAPGDQLFITATQNGTSITRNGTFITTINAGQTYQLAIGGASAYVQTSAPAYVWQMSGFGCEIGMDLIPPIICTGGFSVSITRSTTEDLYVNVMVQNGGQGNFTVNGSNAVITAGMFTAVPGTGGQWLSAQVSLPVGSYPQNTSISIDNSTSLFHLGVIHGSGSSGTRFGYFSNFAKFEVNALAAAPNVCAGSGLQLNADSIPLAVYSWTGPSGFTSNLQNPYIASASLGNSGDYILTANVLGCASNADTVNVQVLNCFPDSDNDGITDEYDLDDDNDGIPDVVECGNGTLQNLIVNGSFEQPAIAGSNVGYFTQSNVPGWLTTSTDTTIELWGNNFNGVPAYAGNQHAEINYTQMSALYQDVATVPGSILVWYFAHRGRSGVDVMQLRIGPAGNTQQQGQFSTGNTAWNVFSGSYIVPAGQTTTRFEFQAISTASGSPAAGNFIDDVAFYDVLCLADNDGDGVPNSLDLDSDNDGIYDLVEAGHTATDANNDGRIDGPNASFGQNGLFSSLETNDNINATVNYTVSNTDANGAFDFLSLNSDGDTCYDVIEAGYVPLLNDADGLLGTGTPTVNASGVVQGAGGYITPLNSTGTVPDFQNINYNGCKCYIVYNTTVDTAICQGASYTLPDGAVVSASGVYIDTLLTFPLKCDSIITTNLVVHPAYEYTINPIICPDAAYTLPDGSMVNTSGIYIDSLTTVTGCDSIITTNLTVGSFVIDAGANTAICLGDSAQLNASGGLIYNWTPTTGLSNPTVANPKASPLTTTTYTVSTQVEVGNAIVNGDFGAGNTGFTSSYAYTTPPNTSEGQYWVSNNAQVWNGGMAPCGDHTTGTGNMLLVNGATTANVSIWCQTVPVEPNTDYAFSTWLASLTAGNPAQLQFSINGNLLGAVFNASNTTCVWQQFYTTWNSSSNTSANICIVNQNTIASANDFAIDDISFALLCTGTNTVTVTVHQPATTLVDTAVCNGVIYTFPLGNTSVISANDTALLTDQFGCDSTVITTLTVHPTPITSVSDTICANDTYMLPSGNAVNATGVYYDTLSTSLGCDSVIITDLTVFPVSATSLSDTICAGDSYALPDGNIVSVSGIYPVTLSNLYGCDSVVTTALTVIQVTLSTSVTDVTCFGHGDGSILATATAGVAPYLYDLQLGGSTIANNSNGNFQNLSGGSYTVITTDDFGCTAAVNASINEPTLLQSTITPEDVSCFGEQDGSIAAVASGGTPSYTFALSSGASNNSGSFGSLNAGNYSLTITDDNGCIDSATITITEPMQVLVTLSPDSVTLNLGESIQLNASSNYGTANYLWSPSIGLSCNDCNNPTTTLYNSLTYQLTVSVAINGTNCYAYTEVPVTVIKNYDLFIPNVFTPNGDGANDLFRLFGNLPALKFVEMQIFNRTGEKVFESNDINFSWDGTYKGKALEPQVLVYTLYAVFLDNHSEELFKGSITILR